MNRLWLASALILLVSCSGPAPEAGTTPVAPGADPRSWELNSAEKAWVESRRAEGGIRVASTETPGAFSVADPGQPTGFHADLARSLGQFLDLPLTFVPVSFDTYFSNKGVIPETVKTDPALAYEPDVFLKADVVAFNLGALPWRSKLMEFHPVFPNRVVLVTLRGKEIVQLSDLVNRKVVVFANSSHELTLRRIQANLGLDFEVLSVPYDNDLFAFVREGKADAMARDSNVMMLQLAKNPDFNVTLPVTPTEPMNWAVSLKNPELGTILEKFLLKARATGEMAEFWQKAYGLTFEAYTNLIGEDPPIDWTDQEKKVLETLRITGLRAAIDAEQTIFEPQSDGSARGITYNLLLDVARRLEVPLKLRTTAFHEYFDRGGRFPEQVKTDPNYLYRPDLLDQVDVYADTFSPLDWRKKFLAFVSLYPSKLVWVVRKDGTTGPDQGKKVAVLSQSSYQDWLLAGKKVRSEDLVLTSSGDEAVRMVVESRADLTVSDANLALGWLAKYPGITFFPADQAVQDLSWAVAKENGPLREVLSKALDSLRRSGTFSSIWQGYYHVSLNEYLSLLAMDNVP